MEKKRENSVNRFSAGFKRPLRFLNFLGSQARKDRSMS
jgi:hypothetical protein